MLRVRPGVLLVRASLVPIKELMTLDFPDLDLEADLGIDTVKQAEMFASVRTAFGIPRDENLKLRNFPTLAHVIEFARERKPEAPKTTAPAALSLAQAPDRKSVV